MTKKEIADDFKRMWDELHNKDLIAKNKRLAEIKKIKEQKIKDTGL